MFKFRFETLLAARRHAEEALQKELADARRALAVEQAVLRDKKNMRRACLKNLRRKQGQRFRSPEIHLYGPYLQRLERDIDIQQKRVAGAERHVNQKRLILMDVLKKRKILEKLKERDQKAYLETLAVRERKFIDEAAGRNHAAAGRRP
jgi:flagellar export protein FliJ